jgi:hypothetical protein
VSGGAEGGERVLGVVECFTATRDQCPSGAVQRVARQGLYAIAREGAAAIPAQAFYLLTAVRGWQGDRARQVKRSLERYLAEQERRGDPEAPAGAGGPGS